MKYVKLERDGAAVWGVLEGELIRTLAKYFPSSPSLSASWAL